LYLFDESQAAVESAKLGFAHNYSDIEPESLHIQHNDGLRDVIEKFDLILINPPFHQQNTVTTDIAESMFKQAKHNLAEGGELWIVANQHLEYYKPLKRLFRQTFEKFRNKKFVILLAKN
jgi:23S rRNA (guanine1835-N2)-methyltransferase